MGERGVVGLKRKKRRGVMGERGVVGMKKERWLGWGEKEMDRKERERGRGKHADGKEVRMRQRRGWGRVERWERKMVVGWRRECGVMRERGWRDRRVKGTIKRWE